jgi:hypothetical protein
MKYVVQVMAVISHYLRVNVLVQRFLKRARFLWNGYATFSYTWVYIVVYSAEADSTPSGKGYSSRIMRLVRDMLVEHIDTRVVFKMKDDLIL